LTASNTIRIAMIGFGEVGQRFARDFLKREGLEIAAYDVLFDAAPSGAMKTSPAIARELGVKPAPSAHAAVDGALYVFSAVTADRAAAEAGADFRRCEFGGAKH
jgi:3-hydroxyisobutyrate dehydrogenase-like beta-hydroxyacid dehydrogenase